MPSSLLLLEGYQHSQEQKGVVEDLRGKMLYTGSLVARVPEVRGGEGRGGEGRVGQGRAG